MKNYLMSLFCLVILISCFTACTKTEVVENSDDLNIEPTNYLEMKTENVTYSLNFMDDSHWLTGSLIKSDKVYDISAINFSENPKDFIKNVSSEEGYVVVSYEFGKVTFFGFQVLDNGISFNSIDDKGNVIEYNWEHNVLEINKTQTLNEQFANIIQVAINHEHFAEEGDRVDGKLTWTCVAGTAIVAIGGIVAGTLNHCENVIEAVADSCTKCLEASFCSATCVSCPE